MTKKYLGEKEVSIAETEYKKFTPAEWALEWIERYGGFDGAHHKAWCIDQITRILHGTPVVVSVASWGNGEWEYRLRLGDASDSYLKYREATEADGYDYDEGIAP